MASAVAASAQSHHYEIDTNIRDKKPREGGLQLGGSSASGNKIAVNNLYVSVNKEPFIPIAGEFHYSRYANEYWEESIQKMKAGGINMIATYVFWNIHEDKEGEFRWDGDRDIRKFVELCAKYNMYVVVRVGPFDHGEIRNGGLPDWLLGKPLMIRSNDPMYLSYTEKLYNQIGQQLKGLYFKDNGPIIGVQVENEYQHSAAPWGLSYPGQPLDFTASERDLAATHNGVSVAEGTNANAEAGNSHMKTLKQLAIKAGMDVPLWTATGWGYAAVIPNESIPVMAAYAYPFWTEGKDLSPFFLYKDMRKVPDYAPVRYNPDDYPVFAAELGSGIMSVYSRRPIAVHKSFDAMINRCLGSGCNGIGYYMYHGGSTPKGDFYFNDEAFGLPKISYDFQAPIGEFGQVREGFHRLKLLHYFVQDFGGLLAPMSTILPKNNAAITPENTKDLRYAVRAKGNSGFLFVNNFQDDAPSADKNDIQLKVKTAKGTISIPAEGGFSLKSDENIILPYNFDLNGTNLVYATAQLLLKGDSGNNPYYIFFRPDGAKAEFLFDKKAAISQLTGAHTEQTKSGTLVKTDAAMAQFTLSAKGKKVTVLVIEKQLALQAYPVKVGGGEYVAFSDAVVLTQKDGSLKLLFDNQNTTGFSLYPAYNGALSASIGAATAKGKSDVFSEYTVSVPPVSIAPSVKKIGDKKYVVALPESIGSLNNLYLEADYTADTAMGFVDGVLVTDEFYKGFPWQIGLRKFLPTAKTKEMVFYFRPLSKDATFLNDLRPEDVPDFKGQPQLLKVKGFKITPQYTTTIQFR